MRQVRKVHCSRMKTRCVGSPLPATSVLRDGARGSSARLTRKSIMVRQRLHHGLSPNRAQGQCCGASLASSRRFQSGLCRNGTCFSEACPVDVQEATAENRQCPVPSEPPQCSSIPLFGSFGKGCPHTSTDLSRQVAKDAQSWWWQIPSRRGPPQNARSSGPTESAVASAPVKMVRFAQVLKEPCGRRAC